jgi:hypothetical protein
MESFLDRVDSDIVPLAGIALGAVAIIGGFIVAIVTGIAGSVRRSKLDDMEATLKMEMIQRGMTAEDIKKVLEARMGASVAADAECAGHAEKWHWGHNCKQRAAKAV